MMFKQNRFRQKWMKKSLFSTIVVALLGSSSSTSSDKFYYDSSGCSAKRE